MDLKEGQEEVSGGGGGCIRTDQEPRVGEMLEQEGSVTKSVTESQPGTSQNDRDDDKAKQIPKRKEVQPKGPVQAKAKDKRVGYCDIPNCGKRSEQLVGATAAVLTYFGLHYRLMKFKACPSCVVKAEEFEKKSVEAITNFRCTFALKHEPQPFPMIQNVDEEDGSDNDRLPGRSQSEELVELDCERSEIDSVVKSILGRCNIKSQMKACQEQTVDEATRLRKKRYFIVETDNEMEDLDKLMESTADTISQACNRLQTVFGSKPQCVVKQEVEINADGSVRKRNLPSEDDLVFANEDAMKRLNTDTAAPWKGVQKPCPEITEIKAETNDPNSTFLLKPTPAVIPRIKPKVGDIMYALDNDALKCWLQAEVLEVIENTDTKQTEFIVHYEPTKNGVATGGTEAIGSVRGIRQLCLRELAYSFPYPFHLPVGFRVVAKYKDDELKANQNSAGGYYAGIIAEPAKQTTGRRYLIFFDDGSVQYVNPDEVLAVCERSKEVWNDVHSDAYDFIKEYMTRYPEWPKVKLSKDAMVSTEWHGKWMVARVVELDCSLAKVQFENDGRVEWIYRGSPRFRPIYKMLRKKEDAKENRQHKIPTRLNSWGKEPPVVVEVTGSPIDSNKRAIKSTVGRKGLLQEKIVNGASSRNQPSFTATDPDLCIEYQGTIKKVKVPDDAPKPKDYVPHECSSGCVITYVPNSDMKGSSPLSVPLFFGWARELGRHPNPSIYYQTPCGLRLRNYDELTKYLRTTNSNLSLDFFSFDHEINCLDEFIPARSLYIRKDVSDGKEAVPVQCVNSVDYDTLPCLEYTPERLLGEGVDLNTDNNFLVCCDCTDGCEDRTKCACWKLTMDGISWKALNDPSEPTRGYENRRLREHILSGIYECNSSCKCKKTCTNRVVQNGVMWPIQIFKTTKKGWGIRALYDMPAGAFICTYTGEILTEQAANEDGLEFGDEYLAALDFIEINESIKAGYESDVSDIEEDLPGRNDDVVPGKKSRIEQENSDTSTNIKSTSPSTSKFRLFAARRTDGQKSNLGNILDTNEELLQTRVASCFPPEVTRKKRSTVSLRNLYGEGEGYLMDAKTKGNFGRYLNHSCRPNVFVQNVFVNTHDLRFPMVAFFTNCAVKAGTELTWDYHYDVGSVTDKLIYCHCMTPYCRGRLL